MDRETMLKRLKAGYDPIDIAIEKWMDIKETNDWKNTGLDNCALCEVYHSNPKCKGCPLKFCDVDTVYGLTLENRDAQIMIDALQKIKKERKLTEEIPEKFIEERTYFIGQRFRHIDTEYILARCDTKMSKGNFCALINLRDGNTWAFAHQVKSLGKITETEFKEIVGIPNRIKDFKEILNE